MILRYQRVHPDGNGEDCVSPDSFRQQMLDLQRRDVVSLDDYDPASDARQAVLTFDGISSSILEFAVPVIEEFGYPFELFPTSGEANDERFASEAQLAELVARGGRIREDTEERGRWERLTVSEGVAVTQRKVTIIIPCHNYGRFLPEAIESALRQTRRADEILISDDASTDDSFEIAEFYQSEHPHRIKLNRNEKNLGIVDHFNKALGIASGDYVALLGADNRFRSDYLERTCTALDKNPEAAIAYTDFCLFGDRAGAVYGDFVKRFEGTVREGSLFEVRFPDFDESVVALMAAGVNCMHGSSMFRRRAWEEAGGYQPRTDAPEDFSLFKRMLDDGWGAVHVAAPVLEYRQHSADQDNIKLRSQIALNCYRRKLEKVAGELERRREESEVLKEKLRRATDQRDEKKAELKAIKKRLSWNITKPLRIVERWLGR